MLNSMEQKAFLKMIGNKIRAIRKSKRISQERLAELSGLHPTYVSDLENGKTNASIMSYLAITNALDIPITDILTLPSGRQDRKIEAEVAEVLAQFRKLDKKKQGIFLSAAKGLVSGIQNS